MNVKNNSRYKESSEKIETAFLSLILKHGYENVTVSQIVKEAGINRSTFYCHYDDINDLIIKVEKRFAKATASIFDFGENKSHQAFIDMFTFIKNNAHFYKAFLSLPYSTSAENKTKIEVLENIGRKAGGKLAGNIGIYYRASFFGAGIKEMCRLWLERGCKETPEQMATLLIDEYGGRKQ